MNQPADATSESNDSGPGILKAFVTSDDLASFNWQEKLEDIDGPYNRFGHVTRLGQLAEALNTEAPVQSAVLRLLSAVISMQLLVNTSKPFVAALQMSDRRSAMPDDLGEHDLTALEMMASQARSPWLRARLADVGLIVSQNHAKPSWQLGAMAARAYLDHARLDSEHDIERRESLQRAMELGWRYTRRDEAFHASLWETAMTLIRKGLSDSAPGVSVPLADEVISRNRDMASEAASMFEKQADSVFAKNADPLAANTYRQAAKLWQAAKDVDRAQKAHHRTADVLIALARAPGQAMLQADWMSEGIAILRRHKGDRAQIRDLQVELAEIRARIIGEMSTISHPIDTSAIVAHIRSRMTADNLGDALIQVAFAFSNWVDAKEERDRVIDNAKRYVFSNFLSRVTYDEHGVPIDVTPPFDESNEEDLEKRVVQQVAQFQHPLLARVAIPCALDILQTKFEPTMADILGLLYESPFTPRGHEWSLARGLLAGLNLDWEEAAVFLIPQAEPFIRAAFKRRGINTLSHNSATAGVEEEKSLGELLAHPEVESVLSSDIVLELKTLLTHKAGHNLRNLYGHGLIPDANLANVGTTVLWWTILRLVLWPYRGRAVELIRQTESKVSPTETNNDAPPGSTGTME